MNKTSCVFCGKKFESDGSWFGGCDECYEKAPVWIQDEWDIIGNTMSNSTVKMENPAAFNRGMWLFLDPCDEGDCEVYKVKDLESAKKKIEDRKERGYVFGSLYKDGKKLNLKMKLVEE